MKIAVITNEVHNMVGGIEKVNRTIYKLFSEKHDFTEFPTLKDNRVKDKIVSPLNKSVSVDNRMLGGKPYLFVYGGTYSRKNFKYLIDNFDKIIIASSNAPKRGVKHPKFYMGQHNNWDFYGIGGKPFLGSVGQSLTSVFFGAGSFRSIFKFSKNSVFFCDETSIKTTGKTFNVPLSVYSSKEIYREENNTRNGFIGYARLEKNEKNLRGVAEISNMTNSVKIFGSGQHKKYLLDKLDNKKAYRGYLENKYVDKELKEVRGMIMTSSFEGFPVTIVESLSRGVPVILFDTFDSCKYFEKSGAVFLCDGNDTTAMSKKMNELNKMSISEGKKISDKAIEFAKENLSKEIFQKNVKNVLESKVE